MRRGLIPIPSPIRSKVNSRATSAQSKLSQISAALATLPSSPYSQYRNTLDKKPVRSSAESQSRDDYVISEDPKTPDTHASTLSVWPLNEDMKNYEELRSTAGLKTPETSKEESKSPKKYPGVPPPSPDTNTRLASTQKMAAMLPDLEVKQEPDAETDPETKPENVVMNKPSNDDGVSETQEPKLGETLEEKEFSEVPKTESFKQNNTPVATTLRTISEASVDSISEPRTARDRAEAEQSMESMLVTKTLSLTNVNSGESLANENAGASITSQYSLQNDSNASFLNRIDSEATKDYQSSGFSSFPSISKISLAEIPTLEEKEPEPLTLEQSMRKGKVMSARKTVRFDGETEQNSENAAGDSET